MKISDAIPVFSGEEILGRYLTAFYCHLIFHLLLRKMGRGLPLVFCASPAPTANLVRVWQTG